jgi:hypothetical protein
LTCYSVITCKSEKDTADSEKILRLEGFPTLAGQTEAGARGALVVRNNLCFLGGGC